MQNKLLFSSRLIVTILVAGLLSVVVFIILSFILGNFGLYQKYFEAISAFSNLVFGLAVGYRLNDLVRESRKKV